MDVLFYELCGNESFLNYTLLYQEVPVFTDCFLDTLPVWISCGFLWIVSLPFVVFMMRSRNKGLPYSVLHIVKMALCLGLACLIQLHFTFRQNYGDMCDGTEVQPDSGQVAMWITFVTFILAAGLIQVQKTCGIKTSGIPFVFWLFILFAETFRLYSYILERVVCGTQIVFYVYYGLIVIQCIAHCWAEKEHVQKPNKIPCPMDGASILNRITYHWLTSLLYSVYKKKFSRDKMWEQTVTIKSSKVGPRLHENWQNRLQTYLYTKFRKTPTLEKMDEDLSTSFTESTPLLDAKGDNDKGTSTPNEIELKRPSLFITVIRTFMWDIIEFFTYGLINFCLYFSSPVILGMLIEYIETKSSPEAEPLWIGVTYVVILCLLLEVTSVVYNATIHHSMLFGLKVKSALIYVIYKKALTVAKTKDTASVGEVASLMSVDCQRIQDACTFIYYILLFGFAVVGFMWQVIAIVGVPASIAGLSIVFLIFPIKVVIAYRQNFLQKQILMTKALRVRVINEVLSGIKVLKMYAWEPIFQQKIEDIRMKEHKLLRENVILLALVSTLANQAQFLVHFAMITVYVILAPDHYISSSVIFVSMSLVVVMKTVVTWLPTVISGMVQATVSLNRIEEFLCCPDLDDKAVAMVKNSEYGVHVSNGDFIWDPTDREPDLKRINLNIKPGQLVAVVGSCASGKSSLIHCLLGDITKLEGKVNVKGTLSYVPQEAWIQNMTLRDNILFGQEFNSKRYWKVIQHCALKADLAMLDGGDNTEIGEKGINISGGQKQRISLARAVYNNSDIYLMDDPLSAVDANVGKDLFYNVISNNGMLKNKTRILVTHAIHWLPLVDNVIVMNEGTISEAGTYDELMTHNGTFAQFLLQYFNDETQHELDDPELQWIRNNMREQVESLTSDGGDGASSDSMPTSRFQQKRQKKKKQKRRLLSSLSGTQSVNTMTSQQVSMATGYKHSQLTTEEVMQEGSVKLSVFVDFIKAMGPGALLVSLVAMCLDQVVTVYSMFWLTYWTEDSFLKNQTNAGTPEYTNLSYTYLIGFAMMGIVQIVLMYLSFHLALTRIIKASSVLHSRMLTNVLRSPMSFFNTVPVGRLLNRFSLDMDNLDNRLPESYRVFKNSLFVSLSAIVTMVISTPAFGYLFLPAIVVACLLMILYLPSVRKMRRLESVTRSPIFNHFSETMSGSSVIRAFRSCNRFIREATHRLDNNTRYYFAVNCGTRWIGVRLELTAIVILLFGLLLSVLSDTMSGANMGLSVTYAYQMTFSLNQIVWGMAEIEMIGISIERVHEYTTLPSEADWHDGDIPPPPDWPTCGIIQFTQYTCRYRPELDLVLKGVTFNIQHGEKIGVVGRTGAGKSSLALSLFRIMEANTGSIHIDGVNIADVGLHTLRTKITILPQDPVLFSGTLRMNVDPMGRHTDEDIWNVLSWAHLKAFVLREPEGLDYQCGEAGQNLSVGQRQLVCLARSLLHKTKVLVLDEATAAVDLETDYLIQNTIRTQFTDCTILAVAHRLNTVIDYDRVMVLDQGLIKEFATPRELLKNKDGHFYAMAKDAGII